MTKRRKLRGALEELRRRGFRVNLGETQVREDIIDVRLDGSRPRVNADRAVELACPECGRRLQVIVSNAGPSDWRHEDPPCDRWLQACTPSTAADETFRELVATHVRQQLRN